MDNVFSRSMIVRLLRYTLVFLIGLSFFCPAAVLAAPVANAGDDQEVLSGETVQLDATGSEGAIIYYEWTLTQGQGVNLGEQAFLPKPSFIAPEVVTETELIFQLYIIDDQELFGLDWVSIWVYPGQNGGAGPSANAGEDQYCNQGDTVTLDGSASTGTEISYHWEQTGGSAVAIAQGDSAAANFQAPSTGGDMATLSFELTVTDAEERVDTDAVIVNVFPPGVAVEVTPYGDPLGIRVSNGSILDRFILNTPGVYTSTVSGQGQEPVDLPHGLADFSIRSDSPITSTVVYSATATFYLPTAAPPGYGWAKLSLKDGWMDFSDHVVFNPSRTVVTMTLTDGGPGDDNAVAGIIDDPSGLALMATDDTDAGSGGGSSGGSCFIMTAGSR